MLPEEKTCTSRLPWIDVMRILACFMVVTSHACDEFGNYLEIFRDTAVCRSIGFIMRISIPLFVMTTAVLLLPIPDRDRSLKAFYKNRVGRVLWPLVFWSIVLPFMGYLSVEFLEKTSLEEIFSIERMSDNQIFRHMWSWLFNIDIEAETSVLWYLYMLVGLYFIMPILNSWLVGSSKSDKKIFLALWTVSLILPYVEIVASHIGINAEGILGVCNWNRFGMFYYVSGFIGYMVLAYYLMEYPLNFSSIKTKSILGLSFLIGSIYTMGCLLYVIRYLHSDWNYIKILGGFCSINYLMMTVPVFVFIQNMRIGNRRWLVKLASLTFGIYLVHHPFEYVVYYFVKDLGLPVGAGILICAILVFSISAAIVWLLKQNRLTRKVVS